MEFIQEWYLLPDDQKDDYFVNVIMRNIPLMDISKLMKQYFNSLQEKRYFYLITFTTDPTKVKVEDEEEVEKFIISQADRTALQFTNFYYVKENHKSGRSHWHCAVQTKKPLKKDRFNYYQKIYGNVDLSRTKAQTIQEALNYISKDGVPNQLI